VKLGSLRDLKGTAATTCSSKQLSEFYVFCVKCLRLPKMSHAQWESAAPQHCSSALSVPFLVRTCLFFDAVDELRRPRSVAARPALGCRRVVVLLRCIRNTQSLITAALTHTLHRFSHPSPEIADEELIMSGF